MTRTRCAAAVPLILVLALSAGCGRRMTETRFLQACGDPAAVADVESMLKADSSLAAIRDESRDTPLHIAATCGNLGAIEALIRHGASVNATDKIHWTPLLRAVLMGKVAAAERLVAAGANVNLADKFHTTPLHMAVMRKNLQMVKLLVESGADVNVSETSDGCMTPLFMAQTYKATAIAAYLRQHGAKLRVPGLPEQH